MLHRRGDEPPQIWLLQNGGLEDLDVAMPLARPFEQLFRIAQLRALGKPQIDVPPVRDNIAKRILEFPGRRVRRRHRVLHVVNQLDRLRRFPRPRPRAAQSRKCLTMPVPYRCRYPSHFGFRGRMKCSINKSSQRIDRWMNTDKTKPPCSYRDGVHPPLSVAKSFPWC